MMMAGPGGGPVLAGGSGTAAETATTAAAAGRETATPDGLYWMDDCRLTNNPSEDRLPQIAVDASGVSQVIWFRGSSSTGQYIYKKIDRQGKELILSIFL